jgi:N-formylglutamate deformylase
MNLPAAVTVHRGHAPLVVSVPHCGVAIPEHEQHRYVPRALAVEDTDWHLERLYAFVVGLGASLVLPHWSRYWIDLNRPREDTPMYAGRNNTELCPTRFFTGEQLYREGQAPSRAEVQQRVESAWAPYHDALCSEVERVRHEHGHAVLFDAHSIKSELPWLFEGTLPHFNLGTVGGTSCATTLRDDLAAVFERHSAQWSFVVDGRFQGGHITRAYGRPAEGVHTVQLEMCWRAYIDESPPAWNDTRAAAVLPVLRELVLAMRDWRPVRRTLLPAPGARARPAAAPASPRPGRRT